MSSIAVNKGYDWKLTGFEYSHSMEDPTVPLKVLPSLDIYEPPEKNPSMRSTNSRSQSNLTATDSWGMGCLIWEIFNGLLPNDKMLKNPGKIPKRLIPAFNSLINVDTSKRLTPAKFIEFCRQKGGFMDNAFVDTLLFLEEIQMKEPEEKNKFFAELTPKLDDFPHQLCIFKILPQLLNAFDFGNAGSSVLAPLFKLGTFLEQPEYQKKIIPIVVKLFSSTDRTTRMRLLQQLPSFVDNLSTAIINDQIFPNICQGFQDTNPAIRENTIRSIVYLAPKLNYNNMNVELMKYFARLQGNDEQGMIRTNTTVCIGKIAPFINPKLRQRILLSAFPKAMRDPFPLTRLAGLMAIANTDKFYTIRDIAGKILPSLCTLSIDPEKDVRDEAFKTIKYFLTKLEKISENPDLALDMEKDVQSCSLDLKNETSWTSWAMTSLSSKMSNYKGKNQQASVALNTQPLAPTTKSDSPQANAKEKAPSTTSNTSQRSDISPMKISVLDPSK
jgi:SCY1-like protein 1